METEESGELVVKSNRLIEASYRLTLVESQMILFAITQARESAVMLRADTTVSIDALAFAKQFDVSPDNAYGQLQEAALTLFNRYVVVNDTHPKTGKPRVVRSRWISDAAYVEGAGIVELSFTKKVIPYVTRLEQQFTSYRLASVSRMTSAYAVRVYELLTQYARIGERKFELAELKKMLGLEEEYKLIHDFKVRVLDVAVKQINKHSDLKVSYSQKKKGRVVTQIIFAIHPKDAKPTKPAKPAKPVQLGLNGVEPATKSDDPTVLANREKALVAARVKPKKPTVDTEYDPVSDAPI